MKTPHIVLSLQKLTSKAQFSMQYTLGKSRAYCIWNFGRKISKKSHPLGLKNAAKTPLTLNQFFNPFGAWLKKFPSNYLLFNASVSFYSYSRQCIARRNWSHGFTAMKIFVPQNSEITFRYINSFFARIIYFCFVYQEPKCTMEIISLRLTTYQLNKYKK